MTATNSSQRRSRKTKVGASGLIEIAESLFAEQGLDLVSMRHVAAAAGLSNPASVQYHFGNREQLIRAIWQKRLPEIDQRRAERFAALKQTEEHPSIEALLDCASYPFLNEFAAFSQFLAHVLRSTHHREVRAEFDRLSPVSLQILQCIRKQLPQLDEDVFIYRMRVGTLVVLDTIGVLNSMIPDAWRKSGKEKAYSEAIAAAVGLLQAPLEPFGAKSEARSRKRDERTHS